MEVKSMSQVALLAKHFFLLSLVSFGGASATLPEMHRVLVDSLHLMSDADFRELFAISQAAPGPNVLFVALFGWQIAGIAGASASLLAMCGPVSFLAVFVEHIGARYHDTFWYSAVRKGLAPITIGLLLSTGFVLEKGIASPVALAITAATLFACVRAKLNPMWCIAVGALLGGMGWV
jgi:chromate transporter